jgi:hypothetical protein
VADAPVQALVRDAVERCIGDHADHLSCVDDGPDLDERVYRFHGGPPPPRGCDREHGAVDHLPGEGHRPGDRSADHRAGRGGKVDAPMPWRPRVLRCVEVPFDDGLVGRGRPPRHAVVGGRVGGLSKVACGDDEVQGEDEGDGEAHASSVVRCRAAGG